MDWNEIVAHALLRAATAIVPSQGGKKRARRSHECERGTQECVRHSYSHNYRQRYSHKDNYRDRHSYRHSYSYRGKHL
jgi:hypothetical protein